MSEWRTTWLILVTPPQLPLTLPHQALRQEPYLHTRTSTLDSRLLLARSMQSPHRLPMSMSMPMSTPPEKPRPVLPSRPTAPSLTTTTSKSPSQSWRSASTPAIVSMRPWTERRLLPDFLSHRASTSTSSRSPMPWPKSSTTRTRHLSTLSLETMRPISTHSSALRHTPSTPPTPTPRVACRPPPPRHQALCFLDSLRFDRSSIAMVALDRRPLPRPLRRTSSSSPMPCPRPRLPLSVAPPSMPNQMLRPSLRPRSMPITTTTLPHSIFHLQHRRPPHQHHSAASPATSRSCPPPTTPTAATHTTHHPPP